MDDNEPWVPKAGDIYAHTTPMFPEIYKSGKVVKERRTHTHGSSTVPTDYDRAYSMCSKKSLDSYYYTIVWDACALQRIKKTQFRRGNLTGEGFSILTK